MRLCGHSTNRSKRYSVVHGEKILAVELIPRFISTAGLEAIATFGFREPAQTCSLDF
jgi:hypothetical protein